MFFIWLASLQVLQCKDTTIHLQKIILENFSCVKLCQFADIELVTKWKWKTLKNICAYKLSVLDNLTDLQTFAIAAVSAIDGSLQILPL